LLDFIVITTSNDTIFSISLKFEMYHNSKPHAERKKRQLTLVIPNAGYTKLQKSVLSITFVLAITEVALNPALGIARGR
jgi:hypothetical protein